MRRAFPLVFMCLAACPKNGSSGATAPREDAGGAETAPVTIAPSRGDGSVASIEDAGPPPIDASADAMDLHRDTAAGLLDLVGIDAGTKYLSFIIAPVVNKTNQGNPQIARHAISKKQCLDGLRGITLQTDEQRGLCGGAENMVPIYKKGDVSTAKACIDIFEFPNKPCELPFVWISPAAAAKVCELDGKRLCSQDEWNLACRGDPAGGADRVYAYGSDLDLNVCNTNKPHPMGPDGRNWICWVKDSETAWKTCGTDTEPSGSFPRCRSRFGVFDMHGNLAEIMTRKADGTVYTQLKGSAFFHVDVARKHNEPHPKTALHDTYPDHCDYDPRWHVEKLDVAMHSNYHLGFRCCKNAVGN